jgi:PAS domain S-box-containing protein
MSPEQTGRTGRAFDVRSDIYSLGITYYEMLTGSLPFLASEPAGWLLCHTSKDPPSISEKRPDVPAVVAKIIFKMLAKDPDSRYQSVAGVERDLRHCLDDLKQSGRIRPFQLAKDDRPKKINRPRRLYGRDGDVAVLRSYLQRTTRGQTEKMLMISGSSGIGKSALIEYICTDIDRSKYLLVETKADQYKRSIPYSLLSEAFGHLIRQLLTSSNEILSEWRRKLLDALGANAQLVGKLIPEFQILVGEQPSASDPLPLERRGRVLQAVSRLFDVFTQADAPIVLILDDLQWVDEWSIEMISAVCRSDAFNRMLLVGTYRSDEIESNVALKHFIVAARSDGLIHEVELEPLSRDALSCLVGDALDRNPEESRELAETIGDKTGSNPLFALRYLSTLKDQKLISSSDDSRWIWDIENIREQTIADNIAHLMGRQLLRLDRDTRDALATLACIGFSGSLALLAQVRQQSEETCAAELAKAVLGGHLIRARDEYKFAHDRIHEAAYALLDPPTKQRLHREIALALSRLDHAADRMFEIAGHYNASLDLLAGTEARLDVARLNLRTAKKAKDGAAYQSALEHIRVARSLVDEVSNAECETLRFRIDLLKAECLLLTGQIDAGDALLIDLTQRCGSIFDHADVCCLHVDACIMRSDNARGVRIALECLERFGLCLNRKPDREHFDSAFARVWSALDGRRIDSLSDLPILMPGEVEASLRVLEALFTPAAFQDARLFHINLCWIVERVITNGITETSCSAIGWFGVMLGHALGKYDEGYQFGLLACEIARKHGFLAQEAKCLLPLEVVTLWRKPPSEAIAILDAGLVAASKSGDFITYSFLQSHRMLDLVIRGDSLETVRSATEEAFSFTRGIQFRDSFDVDLGLNQLVRALTSEEEPFATFDGTDFVAEKFEADLIDTRNHMIILFYWIMKGTAAYFCDQPEQAVRSFEKAQRFRLSASGHIQLLLLEFYSALSLAALCPQDEVADGSSPYRERIFLHLKALDAWAESCPETFLDKSLLVQAELARIEGRHEAAMEFYEAAIKAANSGGSAHFQAVCYETAGMYYRLRHLPTVAASFLSKARQCYGLWGASRKVARLDRLHHELALESDDLPRASDGGSTLDKLDTETIVRVSHAISSEIDLHKLIERLLTISLEQSGGDRAGLIWLVDGAPRLEAEGIVSESRISVKFTGTPLDEALLPRAVIRYVLRTAETVLVEDVANSKEFDLREMLKLSPCRSFVCVSLVRSKACVGVLYIEHSRLSHAFAEQGLGVLKLLGAQAAISLENARLYDELTVAFERGREAETELQLAIDTVPALVWNIKPDGTGAIFNKRWHDYTGLSPEQASNGGWIESFHPADREKNISLWSRLLATGESGELEARLLRHDGKSRTFLVRATPLRDHRGKVLKWYGSHTDIEDLIRSERLAVEEKLLVEMVASEAALNDILDAVCRAAEKFVPNTKATIRLHDAKTRSLNPHTYVAAQNTVAKVNRSVHIDSSLPPAHLDDELETAKPTPLISTFGALGATPGVYYRSPVKSLDGKEMGHLTLSTDLNLKAEAEDAHACDHFARIAGIIIERRLADSALKQNQALLERGEMIASTGSWEWDLSGDLIALSAQCSRILGFEPTQREVTSSVFLARIFPDEAESVRRLIGAAVESRKGFDLEHRVVHPEGLVRYVRNQGRYETGSHLADPRYIGTIADVTARRNNEEQVRRLVSLVENSRDCIGYADIAGNMAYLNDAWLTSAGLPRQTPLSRYHLRDLFAEDNSADLLMDQLAETGHAEGESSLINISTGQILPVYQTMFYTTDVGTGVRTGIGTICRDISDERRLNFSLQASVREKDALLKEVHHRVKNNLQLISSLLNLQSVRIEDPHIAELFAESRNRVRAMALVHENLYRAGNFASLAMPEHVAHLCSYLARIYGLKGSNVRILTSIDDVQLTLDCAISVGLIINELVSNALKHAFLGRADGNVSVTLRGLDGRTCLLRIEDDGVGLPSDAYTSAATLGMQLVRDLTDQLGGTLNVDPGPGTRFAIRFNVGEPTY